MLPIDPDQGGGSQYPFIVAPAKNQISIGPLESYPVPVNPGEMFYYNNQSTSLFNRIKVFDGTYWNDLLVSDQWSNYGIGGLPGTSTHLKISTTNSSQGLVIQSASNQTANLLNITNSSGSSYFTVNASGTVTASGNIVYNQEIITSSATSYTLGLSDSGKMIELSGTSASITIPDTSSVTWLKGARFDILQTGSGSVAFIGSGSTSLNFYSPGSISPARMAGQWAAATLMYRGSNNWVVIGNLK